MQYELRSKVIEPRRHTFQNLIDRYGDEPASRYLEGTVDVQPTENFHYHPTWAPDRDLYDARFSSLHLGDPYSFLDPRQYYYATWVAARAGLHEQFAQTLAYLDKRDLLVHLPAAWQAVLTRAVIPLRHYESGAQLLTVAGSRFAEGTSIEQCCSFAAFDRIGNAQMLSRVGLQLGRGSSEVLAAAKAAWLDDDGLQPLRRLTEEMMITGDWAEGVMACDLVDSLLYPLVYTGLDEVALLGGGGAWSLLGQHFAGWFADQRRWLDHLVTTWVADDEHGSANASVLAAIRDRWLGRATEAVGSLAGTIDGHLSAAGAGEQVERLAKDLSIHWEQALSTTGPGR